MSPELSHLFIYPIKSCGGISLSEATVTRKGLLGDRVYMLVDGAGRFVTGRQEPRLVTVSLKSLGEDFVASADGHSELNLALAPGPEADPLRFSASIWDDTVSAFAHEEGSAWFSDFLKRPVNLVFIDPAKPRAVTGVGGKSGDEVSLADGYPLLLCNRSSLNDLNERLEYPLSMTRFRPNVVVENVLAFDEDTYGHVRLGSLLLHAPKLCSRCVFTTVDPITAEKGPEPLRTLSGYRKWDRAVWFGANLIPREEGVLHVGDQMTVTERKLHPAALSQTQNP